MADPFEGLRPGSRSVLASGGQLWEVCRDSLDAFAVDTGYPDAADVLPPFTDLPPVAQAAFATAAAAQLQELVGAAIAVMTALRGT